MTASAEIRKKILYTIWRYLLFGGKYLLDWREQSSGSKREIEIESTQKHEEPPQVEDRRTSEGEANLDSFDKRRDNQNKCVTDGLW